MRRSAELLWRKPKNMGTGIHLSRKTGKDRWVRPIERNVHTTEGGEQVAGRGKRRFRRDTSLSEALDKMENPVMWIWHPWRRSPEPPSPEMPCPNAIKTIHGAIVTGLSTVEKRNEQAISYGASIPAGRDTRHAASHPFLAQIVQQRGDAPTAFPFWFKKYPTRRHAYEQRFAVPKEMLTGAPAHVKDALASTQMSERELEKAEVAMFSERYAQHDLDTGSLAMQCVSWAIHIRRMRNIVLAQPYNNRCKFRQAKAEKLLMRGMRKLRKVDFRKYWEIARDHDMVDLIQPNNAVQYRWGAYWRHDWNGGLAMATPIADFMDPRGVNGCLETGRSRAEVARDLGLSYTRALTTEEKQKLAAENVYHERLRQFKQEQPAAWRERERQQFVTKFTAMFTKMTKRNTDPNWASKNRHLVGRKVLRFSRKRP